CLHGTRENVLRNVEQWVHSRNHCQQIYWIHGVAGCGKSSVATSVADALEREEVLSGSFFCKRDIPERRSAKRLIHSLMYFLARRVPTFRNSLLRRYQDDRTVLDKPLSYQFNTLLVSSLAGLPQEMELGLSVVIVIDALDECVDGEIVASYLG
ncbi:uncharacterized protein FOMMEDRAFT_59301, partial [Fomitiporia mediterranea MF3/22]|uniref:uncharacterized protein n=1 Tax=Fomitiporia mediterranea (strain MF3/22) TaxID=694068 RepID=UPI00044076D2